MAKRKLEGTIYLDPQNKIGSLGELLRMVRTRQEVYLTAHPQIRDVLNNMVVRAYNNCVQKGAEEDEIKVAVSGLKEARL
jgi:hypothetical protein